MRITYVNGPLKGQQDEGQDQEIQFADRWIVEGVLRTEPANPDKDERLQMTYIAQRG